MNAVRLSFDCVPDGNRSCITRDYTETFHILYQISIFSRNFPYITLRKSDCRKFSVYHYKKRDMPISVLFSDLYTPPIHLNMVHETVCIKRYSHRIEQTYFELHDSKGDTSDGWG